MKYGNRRVMTTRWLIVLAWVFISKGRLATNPGVTVVFCFRLSTMGTTEPLSNPRAACV